MKISFRVSMLSKVECVFKEKFACHDSKDIKCWKVFQRKRDEIVKGCVQIIKVGESSGDFSKDKNWVFKKHLKYQQKIENNTFQSLK